METANQAVEVIAVYAACLQGLKALTDRIDAPRGTEALWQQMRIQASRLRVWGEQFNIDQDSDGVAALQTKEGVQAYEKLRDYLTDWPMVGKGILEALYGIVEFLTNRRKLEERFGLRLLKSSLKSSEPYIDQTIAELWNGASQIPLHTKQRLDQIKRGFGMFQYYKWIIEITGFEGFIVRLRVFTDTLFSLTPPPTRRIVTLALSSELLSDETDVTALLHLSTAALEEARDLSGVAKQTFHSCYLDISKMAKLRARRYLDPFLRHKILNAPQVLNGADFQLVSSQVWDGKDSRLAVSTNPRTGASSVHLIEWKYAHIPGVTTRKSEHWLAALAEIQCADDKPTSFRLLPCAGYFIDRREARWGFVYTLPTHISYLGTGPSSRRDLHLRRPISLKELLQKSEGDAIPLGTRFILAKRLVDAVLAIHAAGYTHRNIRASSVLFFPEPSNDAEGGPSKSRRKDLTQPLLMNWGYVDAIDAPPPSPGPIPGSYEIVNLGDTTSTRTSTSTSSLGIDVYEHPYKTRYPTAPFARSFDLYALGLVLLEIGLWQPVSTFLDEVEGKGGLMVGGRAERAERWKAHVQKQFVGDLAGQCGSVYEDVVRRLLDSWRYEEAEREVAERVVWQVRGELEKCYA